MHVKLLVTGGAGYVGSVCAAHLVEHGHEVTVLDDLSTGHQDAVPDGARFVQADLGDAADELLAEGFDGVLHFAARSLVGESVVRPELYWYGNVVTTLRLLEAMRGHGTPRLVFSSTAATYGEPTQVPITEDAATRPTNPYGASKLAIDHAITSYATAHGLGAVSLRYFNVAGAHGRFGERHAVETHLIPIVLQVAAGQRESVQVFGDDWPTPDGTCVRDYIHVDDLAEAHLLALQHARPGRHSVYNLGIGTGFSVREVLEAARAVTGHPIPAVTAPRREGDPAVLIASSEAARTELGWCPRHTELAIMVGDAWRFSQSRQPV
jgi:UDP-glucose 4-epimerase